MSEHPMNIDDVRGLIAEIETTVERDYPTLTALRFLMAENSRLRDALAVYACFEGPEIARAALATEARQAKPDLSKCPNCGGPADNGHDRCLPPSPYWCTKCAEQVGSDE